MYLCKTFYLTIFSDYDRLTKHPEMGLKSERRPHHEAPIWRRQRRLVSTAKAV